MEEMVTDTIETAYNLLNSANNLESENKRLRKKVKEEQDRYERDMEKLKQEER